MVTVAKNTFYLTSALVGQKILSFVYFTLLARFLGAETIGKYTFAIAFTTIFSVVADLGLQPVIVREIARAKERAEEYLRAVVGLKIILALLAYGAVLASAYFLGYPPFTLKLIALAGVVMMFDAFHLIFWGALRGLQNLKYEAVAMVIGQGITLIAGSIGLILHLPLYIFMVALGLGSLWNVIVSAAVLRRHHINISPRFSRPIIYAFAKYAFYFALAGIFVKVYSYIDTVMIQRIRGDLEVGWYSVPYKITYAFQFFPMALSAAVYPALANTWKTDKARMRWIFDRALLYAIILSIPIALGIASLAPEIILSVYGNDFANSILPLQISIFGLIFIFLYFPVGALLNATDRQVINTAFMGVTMAVNILLNLWLIRPYGAVGASIAAVSTNAFLWLATMLWAMKIIKPSAYVVRTFIKVMLAALIMLIVVVQLKQLIYWPLTIIIGGGIYAALLYIFRTLTSEDVRKLVKLFHKEADSPSSEI